MSDTSTHGEMTMHIRNPGLAGLFLTIILLTSSFPAWSEVSMGIFPRRSVVTTWNAFKPLARRLEQALGEKVVLIIPKNFREFWKGVAEKKYDIVHYNQYHYIKSHKEFGYRVFAVNEELGSRVIRGQLTVRKDSGINSIADLKGKTILFGGGPKAMSSFVAPTWILKKAGLVAGRDYQVRFARNPPSAVIATYIKAADAAGSGDTIFNARDVTTKINKKQMKVLALSEPFVHLAWAIRKDIPDHKKRRIQKLMTELHKTGEGKKILKSCRVTRFHKAVDSDFALVRKITRFALGEKY